MIFIDLGLPGLSGFDVIKTIQANKIKITIIVLTSYEGEEIEIRCIAGGAQKVITKPINKEQLKILLKNIESKKYI